MSTTTPISEEHVPAALAGIPRPIRAAIIAAVDHAFDTEQDDYLTNCSNHPGDNTRTGHPFEALSVLRRWLQGSIDGLHVDTTVWVEDPERPGRLKFTRRKTVDEVYDEILALAGRTEDGSTVVDGADDHFGIYPNVARGRAWPEGRIVVYAVTGGSEGHWVHVEVQTSDGRPELLLLGKGFAGADAAWALARRLADILGV